MTRITAAAPSRLFVRHKLVWATCVKLVDGLHSWLVAAADEVSIDQFTIAEVQAAESFVMARSASTRRTFFTRNDEIAISSSSLIRPERYNPGRQE